MRKSKDALNVELAEAFFLFEKGIDMYLNIA